MRALNWIGILCLNVLADIEDEETNIETDSGFDYSRRAMVKRNAGELTFMIGKQRQFSCHLQMMIKTGTRPEWEQP